MNRSILQPPVLAKCLLSFHDLHRRRGASHRGGHDFGRAHAFPRQLHRRRSVGKGSDVAAKRIDGHGIAEHDAQFVEWRVRERRIDKLPVAIAVGYRDAIDR
nr:hypothetical protein [Sphingopyxis fribergensis]